jgi:hypothetical protein
VLVGALFKKFGLFLNTPRMFFIEGCWMCPSKLELILFGNHLTSCDWFWWTGMKQHGWWVGFFLCPASVKFIVSSVKLCVSLLTVDCSHAWWTETFLHSRNVFYVTKMFAFY